MFVPVSKIYVLKGLYVRMDYCKITGLYWLEEEKYLLNILNDK